MFQFAGIKDFDWTMFFVVMIICALGVLQIFSATHDTVWQGSWWKQVVYIVAGILLMWIATSLVFGVAVAMMNNSSAGLLYGVMPPSTNR